MSQASLPPAGPAGPERASGARWLGVAAVLLGGLLLALWSDSPRPPLQRGEPAPGFELPALGDGQPLSLSGYRGRVVLVNFWATWCKPCEDEMPAMERMYRRLQPRGFELVAVSVDESREDVEAFRERMALSFPIALDPSQEVARLYQTLGFPESVLIDSAGRIVERYVGPRDWDDPVFAERIERLMDAQSAPS